MSFKKEVIEKLDKLAASQQAHTVELALNTKTLFDHHVRTSQIEARVVPLEQSHVFWNKLSKGLMGLITVAAAAVAVIKYLIFKQ